MASRIFVFFGAVLGVSFLLLMMVFRSVLVPLKAVLMNVLSIRRHMAWQWQSSSGVGSHRCSVLSLHRLSRSSRSCCSQLSSVCRWTTRCSCCLESKRNMTGRGDPTNSVADGLAATARVISAAAAIMVVVFGAFLLEDDRIVKLFGGRPCRCSVARRNTCPNVAGACDDGVAWSR